MDGDHDVIAMTCQGLVNRVIDNLKHQVMQTGAIGCVADVHTRALADGLKAFQNLNRTFTIGLISHGLLWLDAVFG